mmetsp:Transcript_1847/g.3483  ORF Transcript_1847/g.3483 Transcript_1847/m.3483 type:complete len:206 (+) Transcript_1847:464-1081(+)
MRFSFLRDSDGTKLRRSAVRLSIIDLAGWSARLASPPTPPSPTPPPTPFCTASPSPPFCCCSPLLLLLLLDMMILISCSMSWISSPTPVKLNTIHTNWKYWNCTAICRLFLLSSNTPSCKAALHTYCLPGKHVNAGSLTLRGLFDVKMKRYFSLSRLTMILSGMRSPQTASMVSYSKQPSVSCRSISTRVICRARDRLLGAWNTV